MYKKVDDSTNSGITKGTALPESKRPNGFTIKHVKDDILFDKFGKVVDTDGNIKLIRLDVKFDFDEYDVKAEFKDEIDEAVLFLQKHKTLSAVVEGHTDSKGTHQYNYALSELRAKKVSLALVAFGADKDRIIIKSFGETAPVASNKDEEGRAKNRRVDISFNK